ncbi:MAG: Hsp20/alpha crystallin family protein [bacterium]
MKSLIAWDPLRELDDFPNRLSGLLGNSLTRAKGDGKDYFTQGEWMPLVDITEDKKEYLITAELPDVKKEDVKVTVENGVLLITGERKFEREEKDKKIHRIERSYGSFLRSFVVPDNADGSKITAEFKNGLLKVRLPKDEKTHLKQIEVKVG